MLTHAMAASSDRWRPVSATATPYARAGKRAVLMSPCRARSQDTPSFEVRRVSPATSSSTKSDKAVRAGLGSRDSVGQQSSARRLAGAGPGLRLVGAMPRQGRLVGAPVRRSWPSAAASRREPERWRSRGSRGLWRRGTWTPTPRIAFSDGESLSVLFLRETHPPGRRYQKEIARGANHQGRADAIG